MSNKDTKTSFCGECGKELIKSKDTHGFLEDASGEYYSFMQKSYNTKTGKLNEYLIEECPDFNWKKPTLFRLGGENGHDRWITRIKD